MTIFNKQELLAKFNLVKSSIAKNSPMHTLNMLRINVDGDKFDLTGGNGELQVTVKGECTGKESFCECVPPSTFGVMISSAKGDIDVNVKDGKLNTLSGRSKFNIPCTDGQLYPMIKLDGEINNTKIKLIIQNIYKAAPQKDIRTMLNGVCLHAINKTLNAVATDSTMLLVQSVESDSDDFQIIIPNLSADFLANIDTDGFVVSSGSLKAVSHDNNLELITRLIDAKYLDWPRLLTDYPESFTVNKSDLLEAISTINKIENAKFAALKSDKGVLSVSTQDGNGGLVNTDIDFEGDNIDTQYDHRKLIQCLLSADVESIKLSFNKQGWMQSTNNGCRFFIAPMRK